MTIFSYLEHFKKYYDSQKMFDCVRYVFASIKYGPALCIVNSHPSDASKKL